MAEPTRLQIEGVISRSEKLESLGGWLIVVGLVIEIGVLLFSSESSIQKWGAVFGNVLVALGVYAEIRFSGIVSAHQKELVRRTDIEITAANERTELIKQQLAWREITKEQWGILVSALTEKPGKVCLLLASLDPEATTFRENLAALFLAAGWQASKDATQWFNNEPLVGLAIFNAPGADLIISAFARAGIPIRLASNGAMLTLCIGIKPRPMLEEQAH